jgi:uncharacterized OB-fold protein
MSAHLTPVVNDLSRPFWHAAAEGRLDVPHCAETGRAFWPPAPTSPFRTAGPVEWHAIEAAGTLLSLAVYRRAFQAALAAQLPYGIALIEVLPGVRLLAHVEHPDISPQPGTRVKLSFRRPQWSEMPVLTLAQPEDSRP